MAIDRYAIEEAINENISVDVESAVSAIEYLIDADTDTGEIEEARTAVDDALAMLSRLESALETAQNALANLP